MSFLFSYSSISITSLNRSSLAFSWTCLIVKDFDSRNILHLLDDFLIVDSPNAIPERITAIMTRIFNKLNIPIAAHKTVGPVTCLEYLGIVLDTVKFEGAAMFVNGSKRNEQSL